MNDDNEPANRSLLDAETPFLQSYFKSKDEDRKWGANGEDDEGARQVVQRKRRQWGTIDLTSSAVSDDILGQVRLFHVREQAVFPKL